MKKAIIFLSIFILAVACSSTKNVSKTMDNPGTSRAENRKERKLAELAAVKNAVEERKYVIKVNRLYSYGGGYFDMVSRSNFLIVNGEFVSVSLGYMGRSFGSRPITGINFNAKELYYKMDKDETRGGYKVQMAVKYGPDKFDVYLTIGRDGSSYITLDNAYIQSVRYYGNLEPIPGSVQAPTLERVENM